MSTGYRSHLPWLSFRFSFATSLFLPIVSTIAQPIKTLTMILSVCNRFATTNPSEVSRTLATNAINLKDMIQVCSANKSSLSTYVLPNVIQIPCDTKNAYPSCNVYEWANFADEYARQVMRIPLTRYTTRMYILPPESGCGFGGLGMIGPCGNQCRVWINGKISNEVAVYFHELGHNYGLSHASHLGDQYGDFTDTMGYCCNIRCLSAPNTFRLKWSTPMFRRDLPINRPKSYTLTPNRYLILADKFRQEYTFVQLRIPKFLKYDIHIARAVYIYTMPFAQYSQTNYVAALSQKGDSWYSATSAYSIQLTFLSGKNASVLISPTNLLTEKFDLVRIPV